MYKKQKHLPLISLSRRDLFRLAGGLGLGSAAWTLTGCGGGGGKTSVTSRTTTLFTATLSWGAADARSAVVTLKNALTGGTDLVWKINRDHNLIGTYKSMLPVLPGPALVYVTFHDGADGSGTMKYAAALHADIDTQGNGIPQIMTGTTAATYEAPPSQSIGVNIESPPPVTPRNSDGVVALPPGTIVYTVTLGTDTIQVQPTGTIKALKPGSGTVSAKVGDTIIAQTSYIADAAWDSSSLSFDRYAGVYAPGNFRYYDVSDKLVVTATYVTNSKDALAWSWESLHTDTVDNSSSFKIEPDITAPLLHPKATLTMLRPASTRSATYKLSRKDKTNQYISGYLTDSVIIRIPSLGKYGVDNLQVTKAKSGTELKYIDITQREGGVNIAGGGLDGVGVMVYTEDGVQKSLNVTWKTGWKDGHMNLPGSPALGWGDVYIGQYSDNLNESVIYFKGKYDTPDTTDFSRVAGTMVIGKYVANLTLVKNGGSTTNTGSTGDSNYGYVDLGIGHFQISGILVSKSLVLENEYLFDLIFDTPKGTARVSIQYVLASVGSYPLPADNFRTEIFYNPSPAVDPNGFKRFASTSGNIRVTDVSGTIPNRKIAVGFSCALQNPDGLTESVTGSFTHSLDF